MSTEPGHSNSETHMTMDGKPDARFKETPVGLTAHKQNGGGQHGNQGGRETGFEEIGDGTSSLVTEGTGEDTGTYKPSAHGGKTQDGGQDDRMKSDHGFGGDKELAQEAGQKGGSASYDNGGLTQ